MKKLEINRNKWLRGEGSHWSCLYDEKTKKMCCLGFLAKDCGYKIKNIESIMDPNHLIDINDNKIKNLWPKGILTKDLYNTSWTNEAIDINDDEILNNIKREELLKKHFEKINYKLVFTNGKRRKQMPTKTQTAARKAAKTRAMRQEFRARYGDVAFEVVSDLVNHGTSNAAPEASVGAWKANLTRGVYKKYERFLKTRR